MLLHAPVLSYLAQIHYHALMNAFTPNFQAVISVTQHAQGLFLVIHNHVRVFKHARMVFTHNRVKEFVKSVIVIARLVQVD